MYIRRKGIAEKKGIRHTLRDMFFDVESVLYVIASDAAELFYDVYEDIIDLRWDIFVYRMKKRGLIAEPAHASLLSIIFR
ncbi:hypothetical protein GF345_03405 [Candidatus Woesearchaeota archaeon]|nr:hypothetical protein [Candidatus Woesearchaeota archaeon]